MMEEIFIFGHKNPDTDTIMSAIAMANLQNKIGRRKAKAYRLGDINKETKFALEYFNVKEPDLLEEVKEGQKVILVDHNEFGQSVKGIENAKITRVVDHHKISDFKTSEPLYYTAMPVGCTATILYGMYRFRNVEIEPHIAGIMLSAIISDTLLLKSPTCTEKDINAAMELADIAKVYGREYGLKMLKAGTDLSDYTPEELINLDSKTLKNEDQQYQVAQINTVSIEDVLKDKVKLENAMNRFIEENNSELFLLLITDIIENNSQIIALGRRRDAVENGFGIELENNMAFLPGVVSRKKQVVPVLEKYM